MCICVYILYFRFSNFIRFFFFTNFLFFIFLPMKLIGWCVCLSLCLSSSSNWLQTTATQLKILFRQILKLLFLLLNLMRVQRVHLHMYSPAAWCFIVVFVFSMRYQFFFIVRLALHIILLLLILILLMMMLMIGGVWGHGMYNKTYEVISWYWIKYVSV